MLCQNIDRCRHSTRARTRFMRIHACTDVATSRCASAHRCAHMQTRAHIHMHMIKLAHTPERYSLCQFRAVNTSRLLDSLCVCVCVFVCVCVACVCCVRMCA